MHNCFTICVTVTTVSAFSFYSTKRFANFRIRFLSSKLNMYFSNCCVFSKLLHCSHTIVILCSISSKLMLRVIPLRSLLQQCRNIFNFVNYNYLGVSDLKSLIFALLVLFITVIITVLVLLYMTYAHYIYSSQPICMLHAYCDCTTDRLWRSTLRTKLTHAGTDHIRCDHIISLQLRDHVRLITTEYVCFVFYIFLVIPLIILCQMLAVIDDDISKWKPPPVTSLELFIRQNEMDLLSHGIPPNKFHNLSKGEKLAIKTLSTNKNIMIKPADKGQDVVQDVLDYINEGIRQLSDTNFYIETQEYLKNIH